MDRACARSSSALPLGDQSSHAGRPTVHPRTTRIGQMQPRQRRRAVSDAYPREHKGRCRQGLPSCVRPARCPNPGTADRRRGSDAASAIASRGAARAAAERRGLATGSSAKEHSRRVADRADCRLLHPDRRAAVTPGSRLAPARTTSTTLAASCAPPALSVADRPFREPGRRPFSLLVTEAKQPRVLRLAKERRLGGGGRDPAWCFRGSGRVEIARAACVRGQSRITHGWVFRSLAAASD